MAHRLNKQRTPFKNRLLHHTGTNGLNETSVEVLNLNGSDFTYSDKDVTKSNLMTLRSEEILAETSAVCGVNKNHLLGSAFMYATG